MCPIPATCAGGNGLLLPTAVSPHGCVSQQHVPTCHSPGAAFSLLSLQRGSNQPIARLCNLQMPSARQGTSAGPRTRCQPTRDQELPVSPSAASTGPPQQIPSAQGQTGAASWFLGIFHHDCAGSCQVLLVVALGRHHSTGRGCSALNSCAWSNTCLRMGCSRRLQEGRGLGRRVPIIPGTEGNARRLGT